MAKKDDARSAAILALVNARAELKELWGAIGALPAYHGDFGIVDRGARDLIDDAMDALGVGKAEYRAAIRSQGWDENG